MRAILMRRFLSFVSIAALLSSAASPLVAAACPHVERAKACHRPQEANEHHCDAGMAHHHHAMEPAVSSEVSIAVQAGEQSENCPMDCCVARHVTSAAAVAGTLNLPPLVMTDQSRSYAALITIRPGFSSHTDRGPPAL